MEWVGASKNRERSREVSRELEEGEESRDEPREGEESNLELALALSISHEEERRRNGVMVSTQEYQEDEIRRKTIMKSKSVSDIFAETSEEMDDKMSEEESGRESRKECGEESGEESGQQPREKSREESGEESGEECGELFGEVSGSEEGELPLSQYVPFLVRMEREDDRVNKSLEDNETLKMRWVGDEVEAIPESKNKNVGMKPKPTMVLKPKHQSVTESRMMTSLCILSSPPSSARQSNNRYCTLKYLTTFANGHILQIFLLNGNSQFPPQAASRGPC